MGNFINELNNYQPIPRELVFDKNLSDRARFLYIYMACKPDGWDFYATPMAKEIGYTTETLHKYINELVESGWLERGEQKNENGVFGAVVYTLKSQPRPKNTETENFRVGKIPSLIEKRDIEEKRDKEEEKEYKEKFKAFVQLYKKLTGKTTRSVATEFSDFKKRHKDWKKVLPLLSVAIERETRERDAAKARKKFFPEPKMLQTYLGKQRAWEMFVNPDEDPEELKRTYMPYTDGAIRWSDTKKCYIYVNMYFGYIPDGYDDNERPDGATIMLNNSCEIIKWNAENKKWEKVV